ncbi:hypothetical protein KY290_001210 [Solanum tuberosum]|uniref:F-box associated domain-containing protein n=1 Tax=Solanum tuberosum TaxID=4113 RepID=A0ABQ7WLI2_SOLTU|nr:hypothetical protein KY290_001210 [Solanum tuberosum]
MAMSRKLPDEMIEEIVSRMPVKLEDVAFLINPTTLEYRRIPNSPLALPKCGTSTAYALGINENEIDVRMMKEYGVVESWTKFSVVKNTFRFCPTPVCLMSDDDIILAAPGKAKLIIYNKKKEQQREMNVDGKTSNCIRIRTFMESRISPMIDRETEGSDYIA